jgi:hypothetical protein
VYMLLVDTVYCCFHKHPQPTPLVWNGGGGGGI